MEYRIVTDTDDVAATPERMVGRCEMFDEIACGGMATIHLGRMLGAGGFTRTVAIKRLHDQYAKDPDFVDMFLDEARIVARIRHPNVVPTLDLVEEDGDLFIIMEYVEGINLDRLIKATRKKKERVPLGVALRIMVGVLHGLHAAHDATNQRGEPMNLVHRDVSPDNVLVGVDGFPRVLDFGIARARGRASKTRGNMVKGKISYMAPEQVLGEPVDRRTDVFVASCVLWQTLTGRRLFKAKQMADLTHKILNAELMPPSKLVPGLPKKFDTIVLKGLERSLDKRWSSALAMAEAIEAVGHLTSHREVGAWVRAHGGDRLSELTTKVSALERKPVAQRPKGGRRMQRRSKLSIPQEELARAVEQAAAEHRRGRLPPSADAQRPVATADDSSDFVSIQSAEIPISSTNLLGDAPESTGHLGEGPDSAGTEGRAVLRANDAPAKQRSLTGIAFSEKPPAQGRRPMLWIAGAGGVGAAALILILVLAMSGDSDPAGSDGSPAATDPTSSTAAPLAETTTSTAATATAEPDATAEPEDTAEPDATAEPEDTAEPDATAEPTSAPSVKAPTTRRPSGKRRTPKKPKDLYGRH